jgi:hypothetical protein
LSAFEEIPVQPDHVEGWAIQYVIVAVVVAIALCVGIVWLFLSEDLLGGGRSPVVDQTTVPPSSSFAGPTPLELERRAQLIELEGWQWADPSHAQVRMPVEVAIDRYLEERGR